jgi:hypothetical protein
VEQMLDRCYQLQTRRRRSLRHTWPNNAREARSRSTLLKHPPLRIHSTRSTTSRKTFQTRTCANSQRRDRGATGLTSSWTSIFEVDAETELLQEWELPLLWEEVEAADKTELQSSAGNNIVRLQHGFGVEVTPIDAIWVM